MDNDSGYPVKDLYLSAFLKAKGTKLIDIQKAGRITFFVFEDTPKTKELVLEYINERTAPNVNMSQFIQIVYELKSLIFDVGRL